MLRAVLVALGLGLIVVPVSELMFWPVPVRTIPGLVLFYAVSALLAAQLLERGGARGWAAYVLAGGVFGWLIEGVVVNQTYEAVPFSLIWTPLAWHMVLSVMGAVLALGWALRRGGVAAALVCAAFGAFAGLWGAYGWTELAGDGAVAEPGLSFAHQIILATMMMAAGHAVLAWVPPGASPPWLLRALVGLAVSAWAFGWGYVFFPVSLAVLALCAVSAWAMWQRGGPVGPLEITGVPWHRFLAFLAIPAFAVPVQATVLEAAWLEELNAFVAMPLTLIGAGGWLAALCVRLFRGRKMEGRALP